MRLSHLILGQDLAVGFASPKWPSSIPIQKFTKVEFCLSFKHETAGSLDMVVSLASGYQEVRTGASIILWVPRGLDFSGVGCKHHWKPICTRLRNLTELILRKKFWCRAVASGEMGGAGIQNTALAPGAWGQWGR